jgi:hypothetical protein
MADRITSGFKPHTPARDVVAAPWQKPGPR